VLQRLCPYFVTAEFFADLYIALVVLAGSVLEKTAFFA